MDRINLAKLDSAISVFAYVCVCVVDCVRGKRSFGDRGEARVIDDRSQCFAGRSTGRVTLDRTSKLDTNRIPKVKRD